MSGTLDRLKEELADRYELERELGSGGMATVYLADDRKHRRKVAIKVLRPELAASLGPARFVREIEIAAQLSHPHILPLFDSGEVAGTLYYVMPYVEGESLRDKLSRDGKLSIEHAIRITDQVASALAYAHERGVIHRDIKPENILLTGDQAVVADFGIARALAAAGGERLTSTGLAIGTPAYMSPEQATGSEGIDPRSDVYALGCVAYEMVSGKAPFESPTPQALIADHITRPAPSLRTSDPSVPLYVERAIGRALAKDPTDRFASASAFAQALTSGTVVRRVGRHQVFRRAAVGVSLVLVAIFTWWITKSVGTPGVHALAILPLANLTGDTSQGYFVDGVHESLISELAQTGVTVIARASVAPYRNSNKAIDDIARELGVQAIIEGGVFREGDSVEIETRLIDAKSGVAIWNGEYDGNLPNVVALYRGIARAIAGEIELALNPETEARLSQLSTVNPDVYQAYLKGLYHLNRSTPQDIQLGLQYLHEAVDRNPVDARAWAALAWGYITIGHSFAPTPEARSRASAAAERAVGLDPMLAEGWAALAAVKTYYEFDWEGAEKAFQRANQLNPSLAMNHYHYAWFLDLFDRMDEAIVEHERAKELDPFTPLNTAWLGQLYARVGRIEDGIAEARRAIEIQPGAPVGLLALGVIYEQAGRFDEAIEAFRRAAAQASPLGGFLAVALIKAGRRTEALSIAARLQTVPSAMNTFALYRIYAALGDFDESIRWLEHEPRHVWLPWYMTQAAPEGLRARPEFQAILEQMDLKPHPAGLHNTSP